MVQIGHGESLRLIRMSTLMVGTIPATSMESQQSTCTTFGRANLWREDQRNNEQERVYKRASWSNTFVRRVLYFNSVGLLSMNSRPLFQVGDIIVDKDIFNDTMDLAIVLETPEVRGYYKLYYCTGPTAGDIVLETVHALANFKIATVKKRRKGN